MKKEKQLKKIRALMKQFDWFFVVFKYPSWQNIPIGFFIGMGVGFIMVSPIFKHKP